MRYLIYIALSILTLSSGCDLFLEKQLEDEVVLFNSPQDLDTLGAYSIQFWWDELEGATSYQLQVVTPSFTNPTTLLLDSIISDNVFDYVLFPGSFQARLKGLNNSSETVFTTISFEIDENEDLSNESIILISPADGFQTNETEVNFEWFDLPNVNEYLLKIMDSQGSQILPTQNLTENEFSTLLDEGNYSWSVQGVNDLSATIPVSRSFTVDTTSEDAPILLFPVNNEILDTTLVQFEWSSDNSISPLTDTLYVYSDSLVTLVEQQFTQLNQLDVILTSGTFYWVVRSGDAAGNTSLFSETNKLILN